MLRCLRAWSQRMTASAPLVPSAPVLQQCKHQRHIPHVCISKLGLPECLCTPQALKLQSSPCWATYGVNLMHLALMALFVVKS